MYYNINKLCKIIINDTVYNKDKNVRLIFYMKSEQNLYTIFKL